MSTTEWAREDPRDLTARLEAAEAALRELQGRQTVDVEAKLALPPPPAGTRFMSAAGEMQARARWAREQVHREEVEARQAQMLRDRPKQAKRDRALAVFDEELSGIRSEREALDERERRVAADRLALARSPLL